MNMIEVKAFNLEGAALDWAWEKATGKKSTQIVQLLPGLARFVISTELGEVVNVPAELIGPQK